ncbi:MAG TPA: redoxin family protein, partial [Gemmata sp.]|nr:redoxin family protein [Gemmata sp.]
SNSYAAELNELARSHAEKGVAVVLVCPSDEPRADVAKAAATAKPAMPVLHDEKKDLARALAAAATPEAFLLDGDGTVRYRGRIDDAYSKRLVRNAKITSFDLKDALAAVLAGKPVANPVTPPVGCPIDLDPRPSVKAGAVTFYKDVAPILNTHCVSCHRTGEVAPFPLSTYKQAARWAADIKEYTANKQMPPWPAAGGVPMKGERRLTEKELATLAAWADADAPEGDPKDAPKPPEFPDDGWRMGKPDLILTPDADFRLGGSGNDLFRVFVVPTNLTENKWVVGYDVRPGNPRVVHHTLHYFDGTGQARELERKQREKDKGKISLDGGPGYTVSMGVGFVAPPGPPDAPKFGGIGGWAPGVGPQILPKGAGWLLPKGSDFLIQTHYHRNGQFATDRTQVGLYFAKEPVDRPWQTLVVNGLKQWQKIPAGKADFATGGVVYFHTDAVLHNVLPHMHLLGKSVSVTMTPPGGKPQLLIDIPQWDYRWQETYWFKEPIRVKAGTKLEVKAVYDNSEANPYNPTRPPRDVSYGEETTDEMCFVFLGATSAETPSRRIKAYGVPPADGGEGPVAGELTPLLKDLVGTWDASVEMKVAGLPVGVKTLD